MQMTLTHRIKISLLLTSVIILSACAVKKAQCVGCDPETLWRLNIGQELKSQQAEYTQFFKDLGDAQRAGTITAQQVTNINVIGHDWKTTLESSNAAYKAYVAAPNTDDKQKIINLITASEQIFIKLTQMRTTLMTGGKN